MSLRFAQTRRAWADHESVSEGKEPQSRAGAHNKEVSIHASLLREIDTVDLPGRFQAYLTRNTPVMTLNGTNIPLRIASCFFLSLKSFSLACCKKKGVSLTLGMTGTSQTCEKQPLNLESGSKEGYKKKTRLSRYCSGMKSNLAGQITQLRPTIQFPQGFQSLATIEQFI
jgi:hypothetical protein